MRRVVIAIVLGSLLAAACTKTSSPNQQVAPAATQGNTPKITEAPPGDPGDESTTTTRRKRTAKKGETNADALVNAAIDDIEEYWTKTMPDVYDRDYEPVETRHPYDEKTKAVGCGGAPLPYERGGKGNASYCFINDTVSWDRGFLIPNLTKEYGEFAVAFVVAHEWGHAIQHRGGVNRSLPTIVRELQADCFAGAWAKYAQGGKTKNIKPQTGDLERGLAAVILFRDPIGTDPATEGAHGSAFDRVNALQEGFEQGPKRCVQYGKGEAPEPVAMKFNTQQDRQRGGNYPYDPFEQNGQRQPGAAVFISKDIVDYMDKKAKAAGLSPPREAPELRPYQVGDQPECEGRRLSDDEAVENVYYCKADNFIAYDDELMRLVYDSIGDFGVATLIVQQFVVAAQQNSKVDSGTDDAQLQQSCLAGAWAFSVASGERLEQGSDGAKTGLILSPGDLDETVQAFLAFGQDPSKTQLNAFARTSRFRTGYQSGEEACQL